MPPIDEPPDIRALRLHGADLAEVVGGHLLDRGVHGGGAVEPLRLQSIERLIRAQVRRQPVVVERVAVELVHAEERRPGSARLDEQE